MRQHVARQKNEVKKTALQHADALLPVSFKD